MINIYNFFVADQNEMITPQLFPDDMVFLSTQQELLVGDTMSKQVPDRTKKGFQIYGHKLVPTDDRKQKLCRYCRATCQKSPSGRRILTRSKCDTCNIPLCMDGTTERNCFRLYHQFLFKHTSTWLRFILHYIRSLKLFLSFWNSLPFSCLRRRYNRNARHRQ